MADSWIAYFVTSHGLGHAARAAAVMECLGRRAEVEFKVVTSTPEWFFAQSLSVPWSRIEAATDVGLVQKSPLEEDLGATLVRLETFWRELPEAAARLTDAWRGAPPKLVASDVSPLGLAVAERLGVPSVLVENFTWDWIYRGYPDLEPALSRYGELYAEQVARADLRFQCEPACAPTADAVKVPPVARIPRADRAETRAALGIQAGDPRPMILFTMGGLGWNASTPGGGDGWHLVTLGGNSEIERQNGVIRLPNRSPVYPPNLIAAADAVIAKLGYSTVAESYRAGARLGYLAREHFRESPVLESFVLENLPAARIQAEEVTDGRWRHRIRELLESPPRPAAGRNGADVIAERLTDLL